MTAGIFIPELGHLAMILALCFSLVQAVVPLLGAWRGDRLWICLLYTSPSPRDRG